MRQDPKVIGRSAPWVGSVRGQLEWPRVTACQKVTKTRCLTLVTRSNSDHHKVKHWPCVTPHHEDCDLSQGHTLTITRSHNDLIPSLDELWWVGRMLNKQTNNIPYPNSSQGPITVILSVGLKVTQRCGHSTSQGHTMTVTRSHNDRHKVTQWLSQGHTMTVTRSRNDHPKVTQWPYRRDKIRCK